MLVAWDVRYRFRGLSCGTADANLAVALRLWQQGQNAVAAR